MKLHTTNASPYARKVRALAIERGLSGQVEVVPAAISALVPGIALSRLNPLQKVPTMELESGECLYDSRVITEYIDQIPAASPSLRPTGAARFTDMCLEALADGIIDAAVFWRTEMVAREEELRWPAWADGQLGKIHQGLDALEGRVEGWGDEITIGRLAVACALGYLDFRDIDLGWKERHPRLRAWFERVTARPSLRDTEPF